MVIFTENVSGRCLQTSSEIALILLSNTIISGLAGQEMKDNGRLIEISREATMATVDNQGVVTMQELIASSLAQTDAPTKLLIEKGLITKDDFMQKLSAERAVYQAMFRQKGN